MSISTGAIAAERFEVLDVVSDSAGKAVMITGKNGQNITYTTKELTNPKRFFIDIENAVLSTPKFERKSSIKGFDIMKVAQFSFKPDIVRVVFSASGNATNFKNIKIDKQDNVIVVAFDEIKKNIPQNIALAKEEELAEQIDLSTNIPSDSPNAEHYQIDPNDEGKIEFYEELKELREEELAHKPSNIEIIKLDKSQLYIQSDRPLHIKNPTYLEKPNRVIFDIENAVAKKEIIKNFAVGKYNSFKTGQFDGKTFRIVVEGQNIKYYRAIKSADGKALIVTNIKDFDLKNLTGINQLSGVQSINSEKINNLETKVNIKFTKPIIYSAIKGTDSIKFELFNIKQINHEMFKYLAKTEQFWGVKDDLLKTEDIVRYLRLRLPLKEETLSDIKINPAGNELEIILKDEKAPIAGVNFKNKVKIVIDAGHGGKDPGCNRGGIKEKTLTLDVAKRVEAILKQHGIRTIMTRRDNRFISLKNRVRIANKYMPDIFLSVHVNSCGKPHITGTETHWYTRKSKKLSQYVQNSMSRRIDTKDRGLYHSRFYVIRHTRMPATLAEIGFMSNGNERYEMITEKRKQTTAQAIADGIIRYLVKSGKGR